MKKIILTILLIIVVAGVSGGGVYLWQKGILNGGKAKVITEVSALQNKYNDTNNTEEAKQPLVNSNSIKQGNVFFEKNKYGIKDLWGDFTFDGYVDIKHRECAIGSYGCDIASSDYIYFVLTKSSSDLVYDFLKENVGNAFLEENSIGIGCTEQNIIPVSDLEKIIASNKENPVEITVTKLESAPRGGVGQCYSFFTNIKLVK
ncbi:MAG: hypothetical protein PHU42_01370 [Patescibacteria group bacterium]|nr:hypothetical protein [Patescibacteria group bacterium]